MSAVAVKLEPPENVDSVSSPLDLSIDGVFNGDVPDGNGSSASARDQTHVTNSLSNFTCLFCDVVCSNRDELRDHLKAAHASKTHRAIDVFGTTVPGHTRGLNGYMNYRYTCMVCRAKFKSFRSYLTHSMSHRGADSLSSQFDESRVAALFGAGKQYMQDYIDSEEGYGGTFTCDECKTVFMQRDSYAMHRMMRAMNETCKSVTPESTNNNEGEAVQLVSLDRNTHTPEVSVHSPDQPEMTSQRCLEDVTSKVDQDEYLKSVLDKVCAPAEVSVKQERRVYCEDQKLCSFCGSGYPDQDSLAMHVMSDHAEEMTSSSASFAPVRDGPMRLQTSSHDSYLSWMAAASQSIAALNYICKYCNAAFMTRDSLAMHVLTHAHVEEKLSEHLQNSRKRRYESAGSDILHKSPKHIDPSIFRLRHTSGTIVTAANEQIDLYCDKCNITFYAKSEFDWHMDRHGEVKLRQEENNEPARTEDIHEARQEDVRDVPLSTTKVRRNSISTCPETAPLALQLDLPKRPVSAGVISNHSLNNKAKSGSDVTRTLVDAKPNLEAVISNVRALSSNEQRIIYSVFGKDLSLKVPKTLPEESTSKILENVDLNTKRSKPHDSQNHTIQDTDLRSRSTSTSVITKNSDKDGGDRPIMSERKDAPMCKFCEIVFFNKAIYYLHMGLHNVNNPWQCNVCGKKCNDAVDFAAHVIHM